MTHAGGEGGKIASPTDQLLDMVMLRLRLSDGLDLGKVRTRFGAAAAESILNAIAPHQDKQLVDIEGDHISLRDPQGLMLSNDIISDVFAVLDTSE